MQKSACARFGRISPMSVVSPTLFFQRLSHTLAFPLPAFSSLLANRFVFANGDPDELLGSHSDDEGSESILWRVLTELPGLRQGDGIKQEPQTGNICPF